MEYKLLALNSAEIKLSDSGFTGYASVFGGVDSYGDMIHPGAYSKAVGAGLEVKMYYNHLWRRDELPIGKMRVEQDDKGLRVTHAEFTPGLAAASEVKAALSHGTVTGLSIGYGLERSGYKIREDGGRDIFEIAHLREVSIVDYPADSAAQIDLKKAILEAGSLKEIEALLRDEAGLSRLDATRLVARVKAIAHGDRDAESKRASDIGALFDQFKL